MQCEPVIAGDFYKKVTPLIEEAKNTIDICVFDWRWYPMDPGSLCQLFNQTLVRALQRHVRVRAIVNSDDVAQRLKSVGAEVKRFVSSRLLHCKLMVIDDKIVVTGSHNYTQSAFSANYELSVILSEMPDTSAFSTFFLNLWQR